jgi:hypothetical protein
VGGGRAVITVGMQNYGDVVARINQPFDFADGGVIRFDTSLYAPSNLWGWTTVQLLADPYSAPSYDDDNSRGALPREGVTVHFSLGCGAPLVRQYRNYAESDDLSANPTGGCSPLPTTASGQMNRVELRIGNGVLDVCASDAGSTVIDHCWRFNVSLSFTRGFVSIGGHNHATQKYGGPDAWTTYWDNVAFDGPVVPTSAVAQVANASGTGLGYPIGATLGAPLVLPSVAPRASARLVFNVVADQISNTNYASWRLNYRLNGGAVHAVEFAPTPTAARSGSFAFSIPVSPAELVTGSNTVQFSGSGFTGGYAPFVANVDLVTQ